MMKAEELKKEIRKKGKVFGYVQVSDDDGWYIEIKKKDILSALDEAGIEEMDFRAFRNKEVGERTDIFDGALCIG